MRYLLLPLVLMGIAVSLYAQITFSEVMFNPVGDENTDEWIELYNTSDDSVSLENWTLRVDGSIDSLVSFEGTENLSIPPHEFALIHDSDYMTGSMPYEEVIPDSVPRFRIADARFGQYGLSNSSERTLELINSDSITVSSYRYSPDNTEGYTDEKILLEAENTTSNWDNSLILSGTPGFRNSVSPRDYDLAVVSEPEWEPDPASPELPVTIHLEIINQGIITAAGAEIILGKDVNRDSMLNDSEITARESLPVMEPGDSSEVTVFISLPAGVNHIIASIEYADDEDTSNNTVYWSIPVKYAARSVVINEIMYTPEDEPEWVEIANRSDQEISLENWSITDATGNSARFGNSVNTILPGEYKILTGNNSLLNFYAELETDDIIVAENFPVLNNSNDAIVLRGSASETLDSVRYSSDWGGTSGRSLERINTETATNNQDNWGSCQANAGATPGQVNSIAAPDYDLELRTFLLTMADDSQSANLKATVYNRGRFSISDWHLRFYHDLNEDSIVQTSELLTQYSGQEIAPGDSEIISMNLDLAPHGYHQFLGELQVSTDDLPENNTAVASNYFGYPDSTVFINEIMYHPESGEPEWIELFVNRDSVDFRGWRLRDAGHEGIAGFGAKRLFHQRDFVVLAADQSVEQSYPDLNFPVVQISDFPTLNNGSDSVQVFDASGHTQEAFQYTSDLGGATGVSLERKSVSEPINVIENWGTSVAAIGATPGTINSIAVLEHDLSLEPKPPEVIPDHPVPDESWQLRFTVYNHGLESTQQFDISLYQDTNHNSEFAPSEIFYSIQQTVSISPGDSSEMLLTLPVLSSGIYQFQLRISTSEEMRPGDNSVEFQVTVPFAMNSLVLSEFAPISGEGWSEFVEIYNPGTDTISLEGWSLADNASASAQIKLDTDILPQHYAVLAEDSSVFREFSIPLNSPFLISSGWRSLNNSGDQVKLIDPAGTIIDSLEYSSEWQPETGKSLERINFNVSGSNSDNWGSCQADAGATPGDVNSIAAPDYDLELRTFLLTMADDSQSANLKATVHNRGRFSISDWRLRFYHDLNEDSVAQTGELVQQYSGQALAAGDSEVVSISIGQSLHGYHQLLGVLNVAPDEQPENDTAVASDYFGYPDSTVFINEIMYHPETGEPEWIELFVNRDSVDFRGWRLRDAGHEGIAGFGTKRLFHQGDFVVLAAEQSVEQSYPELDFPVIEISNFPTLNNGSDSVQVSDASGRFQDALWYTSEMGGSTGTSLERRSMDDSTNNSQNWGSSVAELGATPGLMNSIAILDYDLSLESKPPAVIPNHPIPNEPWQLRLVVYNHGLIPTQQLDIALYHDTNRNSEYEPSELFFSSQRSETITSGDSTEIRLTLPGLSSGIHQFQLRISTPDEMRPGDNNVEFQVTVPREKGALLLSEFAPIPGEGWNEFVEIYNPGTDTISLLGWRLADNANSSDEINFSIDLPPEHYAVLAEDSSVFREFTIPENAVYLPLSSWRSLNNSGDQVKLIDPAGITVDSLQYTAEWISESGRSLERRRYLLDNSPLTSWDSKNWTPCIAAEGATPGRINSVAIRDSLALSISLDSLPPSSKPGESVHISVLLYNTGLDTITSLQLLAGFDSDGDTLLIGDEIQWSKTFDTLLPADSQDISSEFLAPIKSGWNQLIIESTYGETTTILTDSLWIPYSRQSVLLNEILPEPSEIYPYEFVEMVDISEDSIDMHNWKISINNRTMYVPSRVEILPGKYLILCVDSLAIQSTDATQIILPDWSSLSNDGGTIELFDAFGYTMDSLTYSGVEIGRSLERMHLQKQVNSGSNWRSSLARDGATPGMPNSVYVNPDSAVSGWSVAPSPFSPNDDGHDDAVYITYNGSEALQYVTIRIYDSVGRLIRTIIRDEPAPAQYSWLWDGRDSRDRIAPIDIYLVQIQYKTLSRHKQNILFTAILAKKL